MNNTPKQRFLEALPYMVLTAFFIRTMLLLYAPPATHTERLWLEWLGANILDHGSIPHALGQEVLASSGAPWVTQSWLFALALTWCARHSLDIIPIVAVAGIALAAPLVTLQRLRRENTDVAAITVALIIVTAALDHAIQMRAAVISYTAVAAVCALLSCRNARQLWIAPIVAVVANIHATATLLAFLPWLAAGVTICYHRALTVDAQRLTITGVAAFAASLCSPFGIGLYAFSATLAGGEIHGYIAEWTPLLRDLQSPVALQFFCASMISTACIAVWFKARPLAPEEATQLMVFGALALYAERFAVLYILAAAPLAFRNGLRTPTLELALLNRPLFIGALSALLVVPACISVGRHVVIDPQMTMALRPGIRVSPDWLQAQRIGLPLQERAFCSDFTDCNAYLWNGARVVLDGRTDAYPLSVYDITKQINGIRSGWQSQLNHLGINVVVVDNTVPRLAVAIAAVPGWQEAATTATTRTYVKRQGEGAILTGKLP